jgi:hypothetical protein
MFLLSTTQLAKRTTNFVPILSPFGNELIKHKLREERDAMHKIQNWDASQGICMYLSNYTPSTYQDLQNKSESSQGDHNRITSK